MSISANSKAGKSGFDVQWPPKEGVRRLPVHFPEVSGFDLNAGPVGFDDPQLVRQSRRLGALRRLEDEESLPDVLKEEQLDFNLRRQLYRTLGTRALSGEDLCPFFLLSYVPQKHGLPWDS